MERIMGAKREPKMELRMATEIERVMETRMEVEMGVGMEA